MRLQRELAKLQRQKNVIDSFNVGIAQSKTISYAKAFSLQGNPRWGRSSPTYLKTHFQIVIHLQYITLYLAPNEIVYVYSFSYLLLY